MIMFQKEILLKQFITQLEKELGEVVQKTPEDWDGVELRWLFKDKAADFVWYPHMDKRQKRYKDYKNFCLVNNL